MGNKWVTKRTKSKDKGKLIYEWICVALIVAAFIYSLITGTAPENNGF